ncbi:MAG: MazF family transcriptional regulator [Nitrospinae bacterium RIFCSPLOWO2_02_39_17]|nr:MAG: MazF family transcriptional regulator [Nitrospinae bacterium RIFCSPLOWO2_02_39_17]
MDFPKRGEIWLVLLEPIVGSEIGKTRPAVVISNNKNNQFSDTITVIPLTSKTAKVYPFEALLPKEDTGLIKDSKAKSNQIRTVDKRRLVNFLGSASEERLQEIEQALLIHLGISLARNK